MVYPLWTFGVALGVTLAMLVYQQYGQHRRRQESSYSYEQPRNNNVSHHDNWQSQEPSTSEGSSMRHRGKKKNGRETEEKSTVIVEEVKSCGLCMKPLISNVRRIDCGHKYHAACVIEWRRISEICPVCGVQFC